MMYKLCTVDVWDTLLRRDCHPECVKVRVAHRVFLGYADALAPAYVDHWSVYRARLDVEQALAQESMQAGGDDEYSVYEVVRRWLAKIAPDGALAGTIADVIDHEFCVEVSCTTADDDVRAVLAVHPAEQTIFLSDFYWPSHMLMRLLAMKGLASLVTGGLCSCDIGYNKRSGRLFKYILDTHRIRPDEVVHIGDNTHSDVMAARAHGIHAIHFQPPSAHAKRLRREVLFNRRDELFSTAMEQARVTCEDHVRLMSAGDGEAFRAGAQLAPLFAGFSFFIAEKALRDGVNHLYFLMREGEFLRRVFEAVHAGGEYRGHKLPQTSLLAVSRASTFSAALCDPVTDILEGGRWPYRNHPLSSLVEAIGINSCDISRALHQAQLHIDEVIPDVTRDGRIRRFLCDPEIRRAAVEGGARRRKRLTEYLRSQGFSPNERHAVIDVGWRGTIQSNIGYLRLASRLHGYYLALNSSLNRELETGEMSAYLVDEAVSGNHVDLLETYGVIEMLCASTVGSTTDYRWDGHAIVPVRAPTNVDCAHSAAVIRRLQEGIVVGCRVWGPLISRFGCGASDVVPVALQVWRHLARNPAHVIVGAFRETTLEDTCARKRLMKPRDVPSVMTLAVACLSRRASTEVLEYLRRVRWSQAMRQPAARDTLNQRVVSLLLKCGSLYRQVKRTVCGLKHRLSWRSGKR